MRRRSFNRRVALLDAQWNDQSSFKKFAHKFVMRNLWRVQREIGSYDDAMQEAAVIFFKCHQRYRHTCDNPAWFMALYQTALQNRFTSLSREDAVLRDNVIDVEIPEIAVDHDMERITRVWADASDELRAVLKIIATAPNDVLEFLLNTQVAPERMNKRWCRWLRLKHDDMNLVQELRELLA